MAATWEWCQQQGNDVANNTSDGSKKGMLPATRA